jgi:hypothetical protein
MIPFTRSMKQKPSYQLSLPGNASANSAMKSILLHQKNRMYTLSITSWLQTALGIKPSYNNCSAASYKGVPRGKEDEPK